MQILGYQPVPYHGVGSGYLFASNLFHQTVKALEGTMNITLFLECCPYDPIEYVYDIKVSQESDAKWNLLGKYLQHLQEIEGTEHSTKEYFTAHKQKRKELMDIMHRFGAKGK